MISFQCVVLVLVVVVATTVAGQEESVNQEPVAQPRMAADNTTELSPAEVLIRAAKAAGENTEGSHQETEYHADIFSLFLTVSS